MLRLDEDELSSSLGFVASLIFVPDGSTFIFLNGRDDDDDEPDEDSSSSLSLRFVLVVVVALVGYVLVVLIVLESKTFRCRVMDAHALVIHLG